MDKKSFDNKVDEMKTNDPFRFEIERDCVATNDDIKKIENHFDIKLPAQYIDFLKTYGGGFWGSIVVYSCDTDGDYFLLDYVTKDFVKETGFFPVIDLATGDLIGFEVENNVCKDKTSVYLHEENEIEYTELDFYEMVLESDSVY